MAGYDDMVIRPSKQLENLMFGKTSWDDTPEAIRSWATFHIYQAAKQIIAETEKKKRQAMLARVPQHMRDKVEAEILRLWSLRPTHG